jgi:hypothetical protein
MRSTVCRMRPLRRRMRPSTSVCAPPTGICAPQPAICARSNPDHPTWQRCGSHHGQSKSRFILSKVNKTLTLIGRTQTLSDVTDETDGRTDRRTNNPAPRRRGGDLRLPSPLQTLATIKKKAAHAIAPCCSRLAPRNTQLQHRGYRLAPLQLAPPHLVTRNSQLPARASQLATRNSSMEP